MGRMGGHGAFPPCVVAPVAFACRAWTTLVISPRNQDGTCAREKRCLPLHPASDVLLPLVLRGGAGVSALELAGRTQHALGIHSNLPCSHTARRKDDARAFRGGIPEIYETDRAGYAAALPLIPRTPPSNARIALQNHSLAIWSTKILDRPVGSVNEIPAQSQAAS